MKQIAQYQDGRIELQEVPVPAPPPGGVLVRNTHSVISVGTEKMKVEQARMNLLQKARARPDQVRKVLDTARTLGWKSALEKVRNRLETPTPLGYSTAGIVVEVDPLQTRLRVGDRVACGGAECAFHAEYVAVPDLLAAKIPDGVEGWQAAYTTIASIALQAIRQTEPALGNRVLVMGQGLVGLLVTNLLAAQGARVLAVDLIPERKSFCEALGAERVVVPGRQDLREEIRDWTEGFGVDAAVICTASRSNAPIEQAVDALRDRGRMVIVGNTKADLDWKIFYEKEIEIHYSRSYGPGRYDPVYEWGGTDYPIGYVRWTEQRNFEACLHLMRVGRLHLEAITTRRVPFQESLEVYRQLSGDDSKEIGVVLEYAGEGGGRRAEGGGRRTEDRGQGTEGGGRKAEDGEQEAGSRGQVAGGGSEGGKILTPIGRLDVIGAGNFARTMLLPHLQGRIAFGTVVNQTSLSARHVQSKFGFQKAATEPSSVFESVEPAGLLIATRHHLHASLVKRALAVQRHVFVEKPLCLSRPELTEIDAVQNQSRGSVMVGFNRRFAPASLELKRHLADCAGPKSASFRVAPGKLDPKHWYANYAESGGRVLGEACHFLDYFCFLFEARPVRVVAQTTWPPAGRLPFPDSVSAQVEFADGSSGQLIYSAEGDASWPKEVLTVFAAGLVGEITNFQELVIHRGRKKKRFTYSSKGHAEEMAAWLAFLQGQGSHPLPYEQSRASMLLTFAVLESIQKAGVVTVADV